MKQLKALRPVSVVCCVCVC